MTLRDQFGARLSRAIEQHPRSPAQIHGRQTWFRDTLEKEGGIAVTLNTVNKWISGKSEPRSDKVSVIARVLGVDEIWLALGRTSSAAPQDQWQDSRHASGSLKVVAGLIEMQGGYVAFAKPDDAVANDLNVHLYCTIDGTMVRLTIVSGEVEGTEIGFKVPGNTSENVVLGVVEMPNDDFGCLRLYDLRGRVDLSRRRYALIETKWEMTENNKYVVTDKKTSQDVPAVTSVSQLLPNI